MKNYFLVIVVILLPISSYSQKHDYNWMLGYLSPPSPFGTFFLNHSTSPPTIDTSHNLHIQYPTLAFSAFSDSTGNLLFYTDGKKIMDKSFNLMQNGDSLLAETSLLSFYLPSNENGHFIYMFYLDYVFTDTSGFSQTLFYSVINLSLNGGLGKVIIKNQPILTGDLIPIAAVKHGNGRDCWIMSAQRGKPDLFRFLLNPDGIAGPFIQTIEMDNFMEDANKNIFSPNGNFYFRSNVNNTQSFLYDFNRCTGLVSNQRSIPLEYFGDYPLSPWFANFSNNERFLYCNNFGAVWSYDLSADDLLNTHYINATWELNYFPDWPHGTRYLDNHTAPDGKIYYINADGTSKCLAVIHRPSLPAEACNLEEESYYVTRWVYDLVSLNYPNYRLGRWLDSPCDTISGAGAPGFKDIPYSEEEQEKKQQLAQAQIASQQKYLEDRKIPPPTRKRNNIWDVQSFDDIQSPMHWLLLRKRWEETGNYPDWAKQLTNEVKNK